MGHPGEVTTSTPTLAGGVSQRESDHIACCEDGFKVSVSCVSRNYAVREDLQCGLDHNSRDRSLPYLL